MFEGRPFRKVIYDAGTNCEGDVSGGEHVIEPVMSSIIANGTAMGGIGDNDLIYGPTCFFEDLPGVLAGDIDGPPVGDHNKTTPVN
jgi:hypothetical protein